MADQKKRSATDPRIKPKRSNCPIAKFLDIIGDRWTLLVVRDLLYLDKTRYAEFLVSPESIPTNILAERLKRLELAGIISKRLYSEHPPRYQYTLTQKGLRLKPVIDAVIEWGKKNLTSDSCQDSSKKRSAR